MRLVLLWGCPTCLSMLATPVVLDFRLGFFGHSIVGFLVFGQAVFCHIRSFDF